MEIIRNRQIVDDPWVFVADDQPLPPSNTPIFVTTERWVAEKGTLIQQFKSRGVRLRSDQRPEQIESELEHFASIAIEFPKFADGRGFTIARLLRDRYQYKNELRAVGYVLRDQLFYMFRCGFDAFELKAGKDMHSALEAFQEFSVAYQPAADESLPLFRRRNL
jgi:uncharacterized protein (DUF934 family)